MTSGSRVNICPKSNEGWERKYYYVFTSYLWRVKIKSDVNCWFLSKSIFYFLIQKIISLVWHSVTQTKQLLLCLFEQPWERSFVYEGEVNKVWGTQGIITIWLGEKLADFFPISRSNSKSFWRFFFNNTLEICHSTIIHRICLISFSQVFVACGCCWGKILLCSSALYFIFFSQKHPSTWITHKPDCFCSSC